MDRAIQLQRGKIDLETGQFPVTLITNGEASDGHIIDVRGAQTEARIPMFVNHDANPVTRMGSLTNPHRVGKSTRLGAAKLTYDGVIDLQGDGAASDIRRDVAHGIHTGDITQMSGRWSEREEDFEAQPRSALPKGHYAYSDLGDRGGFVTPLFFSRVLIVEGSIVGLGADRDAIAGRAGDLKKPEHVREFYRALVHGVEPVMPMDQTIVSELPPTIEEDGKTYAWVRQPDGMTELVFHGFRFQVQDAIADDLGAILRPEEHDAPVVALGHTVVWPDPAPGGPSNLELEGGDDPSIATILEPITDAIDRIEYQLDAQDIAREAQTTREPEATPAQTEEPRPPVSFEAGLSEAAMRELTAHSDQLNDSSDMDKRIAGLLERRLGAVLE